MFGVYVPITLSDISRLRLKWGYISVDEHWRNVQFDAEHLARRCLVSPIIRSFVRSWGDAESDAEPAQVGQARSCLQRDVREATRVGRVRCLSLHSRPRTRTRRPPSFSSHATLTRAHVRR